MRAGFAARLSAGLLAGALMTLAGPAASFAQSPDNAPFFFNPFYSEPQHARPTHPKPQHRKTRRAKPARSEPREKARERAEPERAKPVSIKPAAVEPPEALTPIALQTPAALSRDVAYARFLALIRADLAMGDELVKRRDWDLAHRHFMFPLEEIYGVIRQDIRSYKTPPFDGALRSLARTVAAHSVKQYPKALAQVDKALAAADANLRTRQPDWPRFMLQVSVATLKTAPEEYDDAVADGRIVHSIGYQTARGIVVESGRMIDSVAPELAAKNPDALHDIQAGMAELKDAFAKPNAPKGSIPEVAAVTAIVARIETAARKLM
ncbi:MAG TPA: hypothetical protein VG986_13350 [Pseudolabrys sp.]|nr:hypothetical protein [Pseudolabrys sp.]